MPRRKRERIMPWVGSRPRYTPGRWWVRFDRKYAMATGTNQNMRWPLLQGSLGAESLCAQVNFIF